jgi:GH15 family glucan-1,4-alpha-glucosidase
LVDEKKISKIILTSKKVFKDCSLSNGTIVASNIHDPDYPKNVKNYYYVWPRDASFITVACDILGLKKISENYFKWIWKAEGFKKRGIFYMRYHPNGKLYGRQFQPDQIGSFLWSIEYHCKTYNKNPKRFEDLITKAANGICFNWKGKYFKKISFDLWEERRARPKNNEKHTYSLAMCSRGLKSAIKLIGNNERWLECQKQMEKEIENAYDRKLKFFVRTFNHRIDPLIDSSMLGLVWPSNVIKPNDKRMINTVKKILKVNLINGGLMRYPGDQYNGKFRKSKAGTWPLLNFWLSIYYIKYGKKNEAKKHFDWVIERVDKKIPEQIENNKPSSIIPLAWSHAMFIISSKFLGYI